MMLIMIIAENRYDLNVKHLELLPLLLTSAHFIHSGPVGRRSFGVAFFISE